jgi:chitin-binding protein
MSARRSSAAVLVTVAVLGCLVPGALPAQAHGATGTPVSRALECGPLGGAAAKSAACQAADAASGGPTSFADWDNLRLPNVNGRDRQKIPDGKLCSAGLPAFKGLDLVRADWPATNLTAGAPFTFRYRVTIPHRGAFRLYLTTDNYSPARPLRWADLPADPFLTATDPPIRDGSYVINGTLPANRSGRQLIYTIWQTTSTPDTYYSCSDVVFAGGPTPSAGSPPAGSPSAPAPAAQGGTVAPPSRGTALTATVTSRPTSTLLPVIAALAGATVLAGGVLLLLTRRRRARWPGTQPGTGGSVT